MTISQIESNLNAVVQNISNDTFVFELLLVFGFLEATIKILQHSEKILAQLYDSNRGLTVMVCNGSGVSTPQKEKMDEIHAGLKSHSLAFMGLLND